MADKILHILQISFALIVFVSGSFLGYGFIRDNFKGQNPLNDHFSIVEAYPDITFADLQEIGFEDLNGKAIEFKDMPHKLLVLNLWASWCAPCIKELPTLQALKNNVEADGIGVYAVSVDSQRNAQGIQNFIERHDLGDVAAYHDKDELFDHYLPYSVLPKTFIIDLRKGVLYQITGEGDWNMPDIRSFLINLVKS